MWGEKSHFYHRNTPEAVAQAQKGIAQHMRVRSGLRAQGLEPPPLDNRTAAAMERISRAPVGADATTGAMDELELDLQNMGYRDTNDALQRIASQNEALKWSRPQGYQPSAPPPAEGLSPSSTIGVARDAPAPQDPVESDNAPRAFFKTAAPREAPGGPADSESVTGDDLEREVEREREALMREREELTRERESVAHGARARELAREREELMREREQIAREREELRRLREEARRRRERGE
jgi:hypothetical protein